MAFTLRQLAEITNSEVKGDEDIQINDVAGLQDASEGDISFLISPKFRKYLETTNASAVVITADIAKDYSGIALINPNPHLTFAKIIYAIHKPQALLGEIHPSAVVAENADIGERVNIGPNVTIAKGVSLADGVIIAAGCVIEENCQLAKGVRLHANVTLYADTKVGANTIIHSGAVIGSDGFGYVPQADNSWYKILQVGNVVIGDNAEIGANTTIDRAALGSTTIADGVKLDNLIHIAHNVQIGEDTVIAACVGIAGSTTIGKRCQLGGTVAMGGHLTITDDVIITGNTMVTKSIKKAGVYSSGMPADENGKWRRNVARFKQLDELAKTVKKLDRNTK